MTTFYEIIHALGFLGLIIIALLIVGTIMAIIYLNWIEPWIATTDGKQSKFFSSLRKPIIVKNTLDQRFVSYAVIVDDKTHLFTRDKGNEALIYAVEQGVPLYALLEITDIRYKTPDIIHGEFEGEYIKHLQHT
jgi:hypothetical protein